MSITATGRRAKASPNLQNIPIRTSEGSRIRAAFLLPVEEAEDYRQELMELAGWAEPQCGGDKEEDEEDEDEEDEDDEDLDDEDDEDLDDDEDDEDDEDDFDDE